MRVNPSHFDVRHLDGLKQATRGKGPGASPCNACPVRHLAFCASLDDQELHQLSAILSAVELTPGDPLFDEGEPAEYLFNVTAGAMKVYKLLPDGRRQITGFLFAGDFLGLANDETYAYSAEAITHVALCRFPRRKLDVLLEHFPKLERRLLSMASNELAASQEQMLLLGRKNAKEKIVSFLLSLSERAVRRGQRDNPVNVPMIRNDIGDYLGLTTETVSRTFTQLKTSNLISLLPGGKVQLAETEKLRDVAEGL